MMNVDEEEEEEENRNECETGRVAKAGAVPGLLRALNKR